MGDRNIGIHIVPIGIVVRGFVTTWTSSCQCNIDSLKEREAYSDE